MPYIKRYAHTLKILEVCTHTLLPYLSTFYHCVPKYQVTQWYTFMPSSKKYTYPLFTAEGYDAVKYTINHSFDFLLRSESGTDNMEDRAFYDRLTLKSNLL